MVQRFLKRHIFVFWAILALGGISISGWGQTMYWSANSDWVGGQNWDEDGSPHWTNGYTYFSVPASTDFATFNQYLRPFTQTTVVNGQTIGSLAFASVASMNITFLTGQTIGPSGGGTAISNSSGNLQTIVMPNGTVQGGATGGANTAFQFSGTSTYLTDGNPNIYATLEIGTSTTDTLTLMPSSPGMGIEGAFYGAITGGGTFIVDPGMGAFFNAVNSYSGGTTLKSSYLYTTANLLPTTGAVALDGGSQLYFTDGTTNTYPGDISGDNNAQNQIYLIGAGTVTLNGDLTGTVGVNLGANGSQPPIGTIILGGTNTYDGISSISIGGTLQGTSTSISSSSVLSYLGGGGTLRFTDSGGAPSWNGTITDNSGGGMPLLIERAGTGGFALQSNLSGNIGIKATSGSITLSGTNTYSGESQMGGGTLIGTSATISPNSPISYQGGGGTLNFTDTSAGNWAGTITDNSGGGTPLTVQYSGSSTLTLSQPLSGNMGVNVSGATGTLVLTGSGTAYTGPTNLVAGILEYSSAGSSYLSGQITGGGMLKVSQGELGLGSSQNNNTGQVIINNGTLLLYDKNALGTRTTNGVSMTSGTLGLFPISLSGGNQTVNPGNLTLAGTNTFALGINGTNSTIVDLASTTTSLNLSNINLQVVNNSPTAVYGATQEFTLFTNAGVPTNDFNQVTLVGLDAFTGFVDPATLGTGTLKYIVQKKSDNNVQVAAHTSIVTGHTAFKMGQVLTSTMNTQRQTMRNEGTYFGGGSSFQGNPIKAPEVDVSYLSLTDGGLDRAVEENMKCWNPLGRKKTSIWAQPFGVVLDQGTVDGVPGFSSRTGGILFGMDHKINSGLLVGGGLGYAYTKMSLDQNLGKSRVKDKFGTVFSSFFGDAWHLDLALLVGLQHHRGYRRVKGTNLTVESQHEGYQVMPHIGGGYTFGMNECYQIHTFAQVDYVYSHQDRYQEHGANIANYFIEAHDASMLRSEVGFHVAQICDLETAQWLRSIKLSLINKAPLKKGPIVSSYGDTAQSTNLNTTFISPGVKSTLQYADGFSVGFNYNAEISLAHKTTSQELMLQAGKKF